MRATPHRRTERARARSLARKAALIALATLGGLAFSVTPLRPAAAAPAAPRGAGAHYSLVGLSRLSWQVAAVAGKDRAVFGGAYVDPQTRTVHVQVTGDAHTVRARLDRHGYGAKNMVVDRVARSLRRLRADASRLLADKASLRGVGIRLDKVAVDEATNGLVVGVTPGSSRSSLQLIRRRWPRLPVTLQYIRVVPASGTAAYEPGPPWVTGMELYKLFYQGGYVYYTACTAGFNVVDPSTGRTYLTTASHCFDPGDTILHSEGSIGQRVGTVTATAGFGSTADSELITPTVDETPNTILVDNSTELTVTGYLPVTDVGTSVCKSGISTGQTCGNVVESSDATVCYSSGCFYHQEETVNSGRSEVAYYGDSGGPVYIYDGTGAVIASGSVSGFEETCDAAGGNCSPNGVMFFTPIGNMRRTLDVVP